MAIFKGGAIMIPDVHDIYEGEKLIAKVDNTISNDIKVILIDMEPPYIQRFFINEPIENLIERTKMMRCLKIKSL